MHRSAASTGWLLALGVACACADDGLDAARVDTVDGPLECAAVRERVGERLDELRAESNACEVDADCACAYIDLTCGELCHVAIREQDRSAYESGVAAISGDYCEDERYSTICGVSVPTCRACAAVCINDRCEREPHDLDASADEQGDASADE